MVSKSIHSRNCGAYEKYQDAKKMAQETVQKLAEMEKSGVVINPDTKYLVLAHMASFYASENEWKKNYQALLELEGLSMSDKNVVDLQILTARAESYISAGNFQCALARYEKALKLARRIYAPDHPELLRVLQFIACHLQQGGELLEARKYAKEMLKIAKKQPPTSDFYLRGITDALRITYCFDPHSAEDTLLHILRDRWPVMYNCIQTGVNDEHDIDEHVFLEGSWGHATRILDTIISCFFAMSKSTDEQKHSIHWKHKGNFYLSVAEMLLSLEKKMFGENHPNVKEAYWSLAEVHRLLGNKDKASKLRGKVRQFCEEPVNNQCLPQAKIDFNLIFARRCKDVGNDFFKSKDYSNALEYYHKALNQFPSDPKLLTNRAITYVKLSEEQARLKYHNTDNAEDQRLIQCALLDADKAITTDPSWVKGYYWKAVCLAKLGLRGPSLAAAAVAAHLFPSQCADISEVVKRFGSYSANVISTIDDLNQAAERTPDNKTIVILLKEGRYELPKPLKVPAYAVIVGMGKVQIICRNSVPLHMDSTVHVENVEESPSRESIKAFKEKAREKVNHGELDEALSLYSTALAICPEDAQLLTARASTYLKSAEGKKNMYERESLLELALKDSESSIKADPSWILGYFTKAMGLAELERKHEALASAAVFNHMSSGRDISSVIQRFGALQIHVVNSSDELRTVLQEITEREEVNQIVLLKGGDYLLETTVEIKPAMVIVGLGNVTVSCKTGVPFHFRKEYYVENVELPRGCGETLQSQTVTSSTDDSDEEEVISLPVPLGYDTSSANSECKVN